MNEIKLYPHQQKALDITQNRNRVAYYLDMGLGKTFVATEKAKQLGNNIILIVCQKSKLEDWKAHYEEYYTEYTPIIYKNILQPIRPNTVVIINYDLLVKREELKQLKDFTMILDESSYIKNEKAKRSKFVMSMKPKNIILLSGTPTGGKYEALYSQIKLLGWNITKTQYWNEYIEFMIFNDGGRQFKKILGYKNIDKLKEKLREHGAVFMKTEEAFYLPKAFNNLVKVKNIPQYKQFNKERLVEFNDKELVGDTVLTKMLYLRQIAGMYNKHKYEKLKELIESTESRIIIFYNFKEEYINIKNLCIKLGKPIAVVNGDKRDLDAYENNDDAVVLIQYQAGAMGLNLQKSNIIIYFSLPLSSELFEQSKKRTHRIGQEKVCIYYYLITEKSIEEKILNTLKMRKNFTDNLFKLEEG